MSIYILTIVASLFMANMAFATNTTSITTNQMNISISSQYVQNVALTTVTNVPVPSNFNSLVMFEATSNANTKSVNLIVQYSCSINPSNLGIFVLLNGTWTPIFPNSVNTNSCTFAFTAPVGDVIGVFENAVQQSATSSTGGVIITSNQSTPTISSIPSSVMIPTFIALAIAVIVAVISVYDKSTRKAQAK